MYLLGVVNESAEVGGFISIGTGRLALDPLQRYLVAIHNVFKTDMRWNWNYSTSDRATVIGQPGHRRDRKKKKITPMMER